MKIMLTKKKKKLLVALTSVVCALAVLFGACSVYLSDYYRADTVSINAFVYTGNITESELEDGTLAYIPEKPKAGFVFYPGGKVEHTAYKPLMLALAQRGVLCLLVEMPFRLAVLDVNAADGLKEQFPEVEKWILGGHSLGGSMAASYVQKNVDEFDGLALLAAYSTVDLSQSGVKVLCAYGDEDGVMNAGKYAKYKSNLPQNFTEYVIEGGNHAYFGMYGKQDGDGEGSLGNRQQIILTAAKIVSVFGI
jgi:hypothetical protein